MWFTRLSIRYPVFATMLMAALLVLGFISYPKLAVEEFPDVNFPIVAVVTSYPGASPEIIEYQLSRPIERQLARLAGIKSITSKSYTGQSVVVLNFDLGTDMQLAVQEVREKVAEITPSFDKAVKNPLITRVQWEEDKPIISVAIRAEQHQSRALSDFVDQNLLHRFQAIPGVGNVELRGAVKRQIDIDIDPSRTQALGINIEALTRTLKHSNQKAPVGNIEFGGRERIVQIDANIKDIQGFKQLVIGQHQGQPLHLEQVAQVKDSQQNQQSVALLNGKTVLSLDIFKIDGANTVQVADAIKALVTELNASLQGAGVNLSVVNDNSRKIRASLHHVMRNLLEGAVITVIVVLFFLSSWRSTIITGLTLPITLLGSLFFIYLCGFSINVMTLMALSLSIGLLIDDAIIVRENIVRHYRLGKSTQQAALDGTKEIGLAVLATTLTIVAVFLPIGFMGGIIGLFFYPFGLTVCIAVLISMFVSFTLDPMLSSLWADPPATKISAFNINTMLNRLAENYARLILWCLQRRGWVSLIALLSFVAALGLFSAIGKEFTPSSDQGRLSVEYLTPVGSTLGYTQNKAAHIDQQLLTFPGIAEIYTSIGAYGNKRKVRSEITLTARQQRADHHQIMQQLRHALQQMVGIERISVNSPHSGGHPHAFSINIQGKKIETLNGISEQLMQRLAAIDGVVSLQNSAQETKPSVDIHIDRAMAAVLGVSVGTIADTLHRLVNGETVTTWQGDDGELYDVVLRLSADARQVSEQLQQLTIASQQRDPSKQLPQMIPLAQVAQIHPSSLASVIERRALSRNITINVDIDHRRPLSALAREVQEIINSTPLPPGYRFESSGRDENMRDSAGYAFQALLLGVIFVYMLLASQFGSFLQPLAIMVSLPLALLGVALALFAWHATLNIFSMIGIIMLMGLVTKNAILLVDCVNRLRQQGYDRSAAIAEAGRLRLRPILMTTCAMIGGMLPLALSVGDGSGSRAPMAQAIIGGLITSTLLTLVVVPVVLTFLDDLSAYVSRVRMRRS